MKVVAAAALAAGMAVAQTPAPAPQPGQGSTQGKAHPRGMMRRRMMNALNLTDAQKAQAKTIFQQARQNAEPIRQQLKQNREAMAAAVKANDTAQIQSLAAQQGTLMGQAAAIRAASSAKFYSTLTPDQQAKADQMRQRIRQRMQQRFSKGNNG